MGCEVPLALGIQTSAMDYRGRDVLVKSKGDAIYRGPSVSSQEVRDSVELERRNELTSVQFSLIYLSERPIYP